MTSLSDRINAMNIDEASKRELRELFVAVMADLTALSANLGAVAEELDNDGTAGTGYEALLTNSLTLSE